jgi:glycosyltransferase involved in cell wall biosynthesis
MKLLVLSSGSYKSILALRVAALAKHVAKLDLEVLLMAPSADKYNHFIADRTPRLEGVDVVQPWQLTTRFALLNLVPYLLTSLVAILRIRPDVVYLCKPTPVTLVGLAARLLLRKPVVLDLDDLGSEVMKSQGQPALQYMLVAWCERIALHYASGVVVASTYLEQLVKDQYPDKPIVVIPNGVEPTDYPVKNGMKPRQAIYYFGAVNRLALIETLLRSLPTVIAAAPDTIVTIVGGGSALPAAKRLVKQLGVASSVSFTGWVDFLAIQKYVQPADIGICYQPDTPTVQAASNMKVFQYMAMGSVPVVSNVGDVAAYVDHGRLGVVVPADNAEALSEALISLLQNETQRARIAKAARRAAETTYAWTARANTLAKFVRAMGVST